MKLFLTTLLLSLLITFPLSASTNIVEVEHVETGKFLALVPIDFTIYAKAYSDGSVEIEYPWYSFLTVTNKEMLETKMRIAVNNALRARMVGSVRAEGEPTSQIFTSAEVEEIAQVMGEVLKENASLQD